MDGIDTRASETADGNSGRDAMPSTGGCRRRDDGIEERIQTGTMRVIVVSPRAVEDAACVTTLERALLGGSFHALTKSIAQPIFLPP